MPRISVWFIRAALIHLLVGFSLGALLLYHKGIPLSPFLWQVLPAHIEFLLIGWTAQLALGVAFWILPRFSRAPKRGNPRLAWLSFFLLNLGIGLAAVAPALPAAGWLPFAGRLMEALAGVAFVLNAWPRVKPLGA